MPIPEGGLEGDVDVDGDDDEMVVLDPDHPLMIRFQKALNDHLTSRKEKADLEMRELSEAVKRKRKEREELAVELYGVQQELAKQQMRLEECHDKVAELAKQREKQGQNLEEIREMYQSKQYQFYMGKKQEADLMQQVENLHLKLFYMENAGTDVRSDIKVMKRVAEKAESDVEKAESEKQSQDRYVNRLEAELDKLRNDIAMTDAEILAQSEETKHASEALMEAEAEIDSIKVEKRQLMGQWNSALIGMRRRDEAHSALLNACEHQQQSILTLDSEIEGYKKCLLQAHEQNEKLTSVLNKHDKEIANTKKQLAACQTKMELLKEEYSTCQRILQQTEDNMNVTNGEKNAKQAELDGIRKQIERAYSQKVKHEEAILESLRDKTTMDKAAEYTMKRITQIRKVIAELETEISRNENRMAESAFEKAQTDSELSLAKKELGDLDQEIKGHNDTITKMQTEIGRRANQIAHKQSEIDILNKKLDLFISKAGGVELGPLEIQVRNLEKMIAKRDSEISDQQQIWLRQQHELVDATVQKDKEQEEIETIKKNMTIASQRKIRVDRDIEILQKTIGELQRSIKNYHNEVQKLNWLIYKESGMETSLTEGNSLLEKDFVLRLKESEHEAIEQQDKLTQIKEEKEMLLNALIEAERQIMLWEKKIQLAKETKAAVDTEIGQGEIKSMKGEIHRMEVRFSQLKRQQEKLVQEMEKAVSRRDTIVTRGEAQAKIKQKPCTKAAIHRQLKDLKRKIKDTMKEINSGDRDMDDMEEQKKVLLEMIEEERAKVNDLQNAADSMESRVDELSEQKIRNLSDLVRRQQRTKYYQQILHGKYKPLCKDEFTIDIEYDKYLDKLNNLASCLDRILYDQPQIQPILRPIKLALHSRLIPEEDTSTAILSSVRS